MAQAKIPENELERLRALYGYDLLDRHADPIFNTLIRIAADVCGTEISVIALIDKDRQYFFARNGMKPTETPRAIAFCAHAILEPGATFEIPDATKDPRFIDNPLVTGEIGVRFYAAQPLTTTDGLVIGGLCLIGKTPKTLNEVQRNTLKRLGSVIMALIESRKSAALSANQLIVTKEAAEAALGEVRQKKIMLSSQNEQFHAALNNMTQGLVMFDGEQRLIICNERYTSMYHLSPELVKPGMRLAQIIEHRIANDIYAGKNTKSYIKERFKWGSDPKAETRTHNLSDGRTILINRKPLPRGGWVATHEDITKQKRAEEALQESGKQFRNLIEGSIQGVYIHRDWKLLFANPAMAVIFGYDSPEEILALGNIGPFLAPDEHDRLWGYKNARQKGEFAPDVYEARGIKKDGSTIWAEFRVTSIDWHDVPAMQCVVIDISDRKRTEASNIRLAKLVDDSINEIFVFDAESLKFIQVNASACKNTGYTAEELAELTPVDLKPKFTLEQFEDAIAPLRLEEQDHIQFQTIHRRKDGSHYDADIVLQQIDSGERPVFAAIIEDITDRKRAEEELIQHRDHLQEVVEFATQELKAQAIELELALAKERELNILQREFVSMASHEFRTPLAIIDATAQRMKSRATKNRLTPEDAVARVEKIRDAVKRMTRLMESTLTAARMEETKINIKIGECDLRYVLLEVLINQIELSPCHNITSDLQDLPDGIQGDSGALNQVFTNLLSNAVKYAPDAPDIEVMGCTEGDQVAISVRDHGIGIDKHELPNIGERFFRAKTSIGIEGTGIGLNLVKMLVEMHGGSISVESKKGEGSTFTIRLPVAGPNETEQVDTKVA